MLIETENKSIGSIAEIALAQHDAHREEGWTLSLNGKVLDPDANANDVLPKGETELYLELAQVTKPGLVRRIAARLGL